MSNGDSTNTMTPMRCHAWFAFVMCLSDKVRPRNLSRKRIAHYSELLAHFNKTMQIAFEISLRADRPLIILLTGYSCLF
jgi:hypothetical protein